MRASELSASIMEKHQVNYGHASPSPGAILVQYFMETKTGRTGKYFTKLFNWSVGNVFPN